MTSKNYDAAAVCEGTVKPPAFGLAIGGAAVQLAGREAEREAFGGDVIPTRAEFQLMGTTDPRRGEGGEGGAASLIIDNQVVMERVGIEQMLMR